MPQIARLKVTLDEVRPRLMRRLEVPVDITLADLHLVMQIAMGWENYYEFRVGEMSWGIPDPDGRFSADETLPAPKATLADLFAQGGGKAVQVPLRFGDGWEHSVKVEALAEAAADVAYPRLLAAEGACPPEDVGGPWGYAEYLEAIANPKHERHAEMLEWRGGGFDPAAVDTQAINRSLAALAKGFTRKKGARGRARTARG